MSELDITAAFATIGAFVLAGWQYAEGRRRLRTERERLALQRERLRSMTVAAAGAVDTADYLVQRAKDAASPREELTSIARVMRGQLGLVVGQLNTEERLITQWRPGHLVDSTRPLPAASVPAPASVPATQPGTAVVP